MGKAEPYCGQSVDSVSKCLVLVVKNPSLEGGHNSTHLVPLADSVLSTLLEESLVVWDAVLAVDEAVRGLSLAILKWRVYARHCVAEPLTPKSGSQQLRSICDAYSWSN
jgi:hypothetical protein